MPNYNIIVLILIVLFILISISSAINESSTSDEIGHINVGYVYIKTGRYDIDLEHPPLRTLFALPFLSKNYTIPVQLYDVTYSDYTSKLIFSRLIVVLFSVFLLFNLFLWSKKLYGILPAIVCMIIYIFSPNIIAHSRLATTDLIGTCFIFVSTYYFYLYLKKQNKKNLFLFSIFVGLALISKFTSLLILPLFFIIFLIYFYIFKSGRYDFKKNWWHILCIVFIPILIINIAYLFDGTFTPLNEYYFQTQLFKNLNDTSINSIPLPFPKAYILGFEMSVEHVTKGHPMFLMGQYSVNGYWYYFLVAFLIKTPIPTLILFFIASFLIFYKKQKGVILFLFLPVIYFLLFFSFFNKINIGLRHVLMIYPFIFVLIGFVFKEIIKNSKKFFNKKIILLYLLIFWLILESLFIFPHYLEYFNEFIGGPKNGYKYLIDSNLDWGQDDYYINRYIRNSKYKIIQNPGCGYISSIIAINANNLMGIEDRGECYSWIRKYPVIDRVAYTWFIFDTREIK